MEDIRDKKVYEKVIDYIKSEVNEGRLGKGDKIPTERALVEILGIGRNSIREALKILEIIGLVERRQGDGTYIKSEFNHWFSEPMSIAFMLSDTSQNQIFEFRDMIEVEIASLAAERITEDEIYELTECYNKLVSTEDQVENVKYDKRFHSVIARASKNLIIINSYNAMSHMLDLFIYASNSEVYTKEGNQLLNKLHSDIYYSILDKNPKEAGEAMRRHMDVVKKYYNNLR